MNKDISHRALLR